MSQNGPKTTSLTKIPQPPTKNFFKCRLEDLPNVLRVWTAI